MATGRREVQSEGKTYKVTFIATEGSAREVEVADNEYILDAAERQGLDLPATCRGGSPFGQVLVLAQCRQPPRASQAASAAHVWCACRRGRLTSRTSRT